MLPLQGDDRRSSASFAFCILFVLLSLYLRFLLQRWRCRRGSGAASSSLAVQDDEAAHRPKPGLDAAAIAVLPSPFPYRRGGGEAECAVCLGTLDEGQVVPQLPGCIHGFRQPCVDAWLASNASCPVCRRGITEPAAARAEEGAAASTAALVVEVEVPGDGERAARPEAGIASA